jgi:hypothetical protein
LTKCAGNLIITLEGVKMTENRKIGLIIGVLYIIGTISGILSVVLTGTMNVTYEYFFQITTNSSQYILGTLFVLIMGFSLAFIPIIIYPILKKEDKMIALSYVVFRGALETVTYIATFLSLYMLLEIGKYNIQEVGSIGALLFRLRELCTLTIAYVFSIGAIILYIGLYKSKLIPRWLSLWGIIAIALHLLTGFLQIFGLQTEGSTLVNIMNFPIFLQEMVMAVWLIIKGFNSEVIENK